jgi:ribonuclease Z
MRPIFQAELVNPAFGDPGLFIDLKFEHRALLFDLGDLSRLSTRKLLRVRDVFVSHTHMDHFAGFDHLLRVCLGRDAGVNMYGPPPFLDQVDHKLHAYTWNLVDGYACEFAILAHEWQPDGRLRRARFSTRNSFRRENLTDSTTSDGVLLEAPYFHVRARAFDHHGLPSLAFAFEEHTHINVWKNRLDELGLPTGPWLTDLKRLVREGAPDHTPVEVRWRTREGSRKETFALGELERTVLEFVPGQRVCYVTDVAGHEENARALVEFLRGADVAYIEAVFMEADAERAANKAHLMAVQAGAIARTAGVKAAVPFHFSTRYYGREREIIREFELAFGKPTLGEHAGAEAEAGNSRRHQRA